MNESLCSFGIFGKVGLLLSKLLGQFELPLSKMFVSATFVLITFELLPILKPTGHSAVCDKVKKNALQGNTKKELKA